MRGFLAVVIWLCGGISLFADKVETYEVESPYQSGKQRIQVLLPDDYPSGKPYRVLYVLPVGKSVTNQTAISGGLKLFQQMNAHNEYHLIMVDPGFEKTPWFGDHATDATTRQAGYMKEFVVPFIESHYSTCGGPEGRLLFGFSKSGWGAFSLILKYPEYFGYAAAWDSPMMLTDFHFGMDEVFGTLDRLEKYRPDLLAVQQKQFFQSRTRLVLTGEKLWGTMIPAPDGGSHTVDMHNLLVKEGVLHVYDNTVASEHRWMPDWMAPTLRMLMELVEKDAAN